MTIYELSSLYYIRKSVARCQERLTEIEAKMYPGGNGGVGGSSGETNSRTENVALQIIEYRDRLSAELTRFEAERNRLEGYLAAVEDPMIRLIMLYRFVDLLSWEEVAGKLGGGNTEYSVKKMCYRYISKH